MSTTPSGQVYTDYKLIITSFHTGEREPFITGFFSKEAAISSRDLYRKAGYLGEVLYDPADGSADPDGLNPGDIAP